jgi:hypothetical protein
MQWTGNKKAFCVLEFAKTESIVTSAASPRVDISSTCRVGQKFGVFFPLNMLPFGVNIPVTVPQRSEIPEGLMNYPIYTIYIYIYTCVCVCVVSGFVYSHSYPHILCSKRAVSLKW